MVAIWFDLVQLQWEKPTPRVLLKNSQLLATSPGCDLAKTQLQFPASLKQASPQPICPQKIAHQYDIASGDPFSWNPRGAMAELRGAFVMAWETLENAKRRSSGNSQPPWESCMSLPACFMSAVGDILDATLNYMSFWSTQLITTGQEQLPWSS